MVRQNGRLDLLSVPEVPRANRKATGRCVQPANIKKIHDIIRCALNQAIRWEYIDTNKRNPASLATLPKVPKVKRKVWSVDTFREAIQQSDDDLLTICMHLAFSCSMRIGEITGLTWEDVVIDEQSIATNNHQQRAFQSKCTSYAEIKGKRYYQDFSDTETALHNKACIKNTKDRNK